MSVNRTDMHHIPNQQGRDQSHPVASPGDPDFRRTSDSDGERVIASCDTAKKTAVPLQVEAPRNEKFESSFDEFAGAFPKPHTDFFARRGDDYEAYREGFEFGARLATDKRFADQSWVLAEPGVRQEWEREHGDKSGVWSVQCLAIRAGWEDQRGSG